MTIISQILLSLPFFLFGLFVLWKKLREDYIASQIFSLGFLIYFSVIATATLQTLVSFEFDEWLILFVPFAITFIYSRKYKLRLNEIINSLVPMLLVGHIYYFLLLAINKNYFALLAIFMDMIFCVVYLFLEKNFKKFHWYKSGKLGFSGLIVLSLFFLANSVIAFLLPDMVFFSGKLNAIILILLAFISTTGVVLLSKKVA